jgi:AcrR family transcriptional regulator
VTAITTLPPAKASEARERLLRTASGIFYAEGIRSVGVDRIVSDSAVTRATFYRHFPGKQDLALAYLQRAHDAIEEGFDALAATHAPRALLEAHAQEVAAQIAGPGFRGCAFINAASEFEDAEGPVRRAVAAHRAWYLQALRTAFAGAGHPRAEPAARHYAMLRDGAMVAGCLDDAGAAQRTSLRGVDGLLRSIDGPVA